MDCYFKNVVIYATSHQMQWPNLHVKYLNWENFWFIVKKIIAQRQFNRLNCIFTLISSRTNKSINQEYLTMLCFFFVLF